MGQRPHPSVVPKLSRLLPVQRHPAFARHVFTSAGRGFAASKSQQGGSQDYQRDVSHHGPKVNEIASRASLAHIEERFSRMTAGHKSLKGQLLLDNGKLQGSFFHRSVVLICQHDEEGAFGLILNRLTETKVVDAVEAKIPERLENEVLCLGGPVQPQALSYLHSSPTIFDGNVMSSLNLGHSLDSLIELSESFSPNEQVRIFAGYAGWSPGQLDEEMKRDSWMTHPATIELVFHEKPSELWKHILLARGELRYRMLASSPEDLSWN